MKNLKLVPNFIANLLLATIGAIVGGTVLSYALALPFALFSSGPGNIVDRAGDSLIVRYSLNEPYFSLPVLMALSLGFVSRRWSKSSTSKWVWIVGLAWIAFGIYHTVSGWNPSWSPEKTRVAYTIANLFGSTQKCSATECLGELIFTAPFTASVAYSIGAYLGKRPSTMRSV